MKRILIWVALGLLLVAGAASVTLLGDTWDKKTVLTVNEPIQVPGRILMPGKYVIKLVDSLSNRFIVRIMNETEDEVLTTILAIPNYRLQPTGDTQFQWWETPAGTPRALRAWFYPGDNFGQEFAYKKYLSLKIAEMAMEPVPTTEAEAPAELATAPVTTVDKTGEEKPIEFEAYTPPVPARRVEPVVPEQSQPPAELPATATPFPAIGLAGLVTVLAGFALRRLASGR